MKRLAGWSLLIGIVLSVAVHVLYTGRERMLMSHPGAVDEVTLLSRVTSVLDVVYLPAVFLMFALSPNVHQPSDLAAAVALVLQSCAMVFLVGGAVLLIRPGAPPPRREQ